jgi:hypothetical protein
MPSAGFPTVGREQVVSFFEETTANDREGVVRVLLDECVDQRLMLEVSRYTTASLVRSTPVR